MTNETNKAAFTQIIKVMQQDAEEIMNMVDTAAVEMEEGRRNGATGALATLDFPIERLTALLAAFRALHRVTPL